MSNTIEIFITGATGYIGGSIVERLLSHANARSFSITALVRSREKAAKLNTLGIKTVIGSHDDVELVAKQTSKADVVFATADCDNLAAANAILSGMKQRYTATGQPPVLIHTSGAGITFDNALGAATDTVYNDMDVGPIHALPESNPHRNVDIAIVAADKEGYIKSYILIPTLVWGIASGKLVDIGVQNRQSILLPHLVRGAVAQGKVLSVGEGKNRWGDVHVDEIADLFVLLFDSIQKNPDLAHGYEGIYLAENGEFELREVYNQTAQVLFEMGKIAFPEPVPVTAEEIKTAPMFAMFGMNSRCVADRSRALGWKPVKDTKDFLASIKRDVQLTLST